MTTSMKKPLSFYLTALSVLLISLFVIPAKAGPDNELSLPVIAAAPVVETPESSAICQYDQMNLGGSGLSKDAFEKALKGLNYLTAANKVNNNSIISIVDFSLPSSAKRLFVIDLKNNKLLYNTYVAHGRNSGKETAESFSNNESSFKSSLGFYITQETYNGKHGYSLKLDGQEKGFNDQALNRGIVMHSAWYVNEQLAKNKGCIGRSEGCPAIPQSIYKPVISEIKGGTCLFIYSPNSFYASHSPILNKAS